MRGRYPSQLSGGQRQRIGVARALAADPSAMLMDEPFGAIDPINRERLQDEFLRLQATVRKTIVFVTHDIDEAIKMGDRIAILREGGHLAQYGTPEEILARPGRRLRREVRRHRSRPQAPVADDARPARAAAAQRPPPGPRLPAAMSARDALSVLLTAGGGDALVSATARRCTGSRPSRRSAGCCPTRTSRRPRSSGAAHRRSGRRRGAAGVILLAASAPVIPDFGGGAATCARENGTFCWDWFRENWSDTFVPALGQHIKLTLIAIVVGFAISTVLALLAYRARWLETPITIVTGIALHDPVARAVPAARADHATSAC